MLKSESGLTAQPEEESHCVESAEQLAQVVRQSTDKTFFFLLNWMGREQKPETNAARIDIRRRLVR